ncbi:MAG: AlpA family phage regulatory protein [Gammaproteobacteria bacterium]|nr:AlpA family phage regulatory protein [Gammaproteobacteria bacterium]
MQHHDSIPNTGFLRLAQILQIVPVGRSTWWARVKAGIYPKTVKLGPRTSAWRVEDIRELVAKLSERAI